MSIDPRNFHHPVVVDTCAVWNMLSARKFFSAVVAARIGLLITQMVQYECVQKPRKSISEEQQELIRRFTAAQADGVLPMQECALDDLFRVARQAPRALSSGELSCIAVALRSGAFGFMTDEKKARAHALSLGIPVETTPRLYAWLHFHRHLGDGDHQPIIDEHERHEKRPLTPFLQMAYEAALMAIQAERAAASPEGAS